MYFCFKPTAFSTHTLYKHQIILFLLSFAIVTASAQQPGTGETFTNSCAVSASFTPGNDSVLNSTTVLFFTSTSVNATSLTWYINTGYVGTGNTLSFSISSAGTYEVQLVASDGNCSDTATCFYIYAGIQPPDRDNIKAFYGFPAVEEYSRDLISTFGGGYLMAGTTQVRGLVMGTPHYHSPDGFLIKTAESGCIEWTRVIESVVTGEINSLLQTSDSNFIVSARTDFIPIITKINRQGNQVWTRKYKLGNQYFHTQRLIELAVEIC